MNKTLGTIGAVLAALAVSAYAQATPMAESTVGMPNPAAVYCLQLGGKLRAERTPQGEIGICILPDGTEIEEWELYWRDHPQPE